MKKLCVFLLCLILVAVILPLASCTKPDPLNNTGWYVVKVYGEEIHRDIYISYSFYNGEFSGHDGCNRFSGKYSVEQPDILKFGEMSMTTQGCQYPEDVTAQRREISGARGKSIYFQISGATLTFYDKDRQETLTFNRRTVHLMDPLDLIGTKWSLESINDVPVPDGLSITLSFDSDSEAGGRAGNYNYRLMNYQARGDVIGWGIRKERDGEPLPGHERYTMEYLDAIDAGTHQYNLKETSLEIYTQKGDTLVYRTPGQ